MHHSISDKKTMDEIVVGIDVGTTKVCTCGQVEEEPSASWVQV